ncbi:MAG TPA: isocitrate lyase/phosphoenolpyruvate mutase family protein [Conexibacter sp.]|nr:isocitrate lyase/phosphoenolpyruvate mutase family protein [Conexibacter sp.]
MSTDAQLSNRFLALHRPGAPLLMPNPWDVGSAKLLASLGFEALATTSSGFAATLGRRDGGVTRDEALAHAAEIAAATPLPVSADLENGFGDAPEAVAETVALARETGLAGCSVEDYGGDSERRVYDRGLAVERVAAAVEAAHAGPVRLVLTARAENHIRGVDDLDDTIARLQAYEQAGADVLFAPGLRTIEQIRAVVEAVERPVNVLMWPGCPPVSQLAEAGVARVSVGGAFAFAAIAAVVEAARELRESGTADYLERTTVGAQAARAAFSSPDAA